MRIKRTVKADFPADFTVTAHTGAFNTPNNTIESVEASIKNNVKVLEIDIRKRPDGTLVMNHDEPETNEQGVVLTEAFSRLSGTGIKINLDIKDTSVLDDLYDLLVEYELVPFVFMTGIIEYDVAAVKMSKCSVLPYYLNAELPKVSMLKFNSKYRQSLLTKLRETGAIGYNIKHIYATKALSQLLHDNGFLLSVWTANDENVIYKMIECSPDNITTQKYELVLKVIDDVTTNR